MVPVDGSNLPPPTTHTQRILMRYGVVENIHCSNEDDDMVIFNICVHLAV